MSVFILQNISKTFTTNKKKNTVLKNINISFPNRGLFSIVGKSGCGKSTLLNILMGIERPTSGKVFFNGKNISKLTDKKFSQYHLNGVSLVFQHYNLFDDLTVLDNIKLPLEIAGEKTKDCISKTNDLLKELNIEELANRKVKNLSGGEKQRVAILRSIITNPKALLCDEPTGALDSQNSREIMGILRKISKNTLVIMVSHNKELVDEFSDEILTLTNGEIDKQIKPGIVNSKEKIKCHYSGKWTSKFLKVNLIKNIKKDLLSIVACLLSFASMFLAVGFSEGSKLSQADALKKNLGLGFATASESQFVEIEGSPLSFEKTIKPKVELVDKYFGEFNSIRLEENFSYFISNFPSCYLDDNKVDGFEMIPIYDMTLESYGMNMLVSGEPANNSFDEVLVNEEFAKLYKETILNKELIISNNAFVNYSTGNQENPLIKDELNFAKKMKIKGIVKEFSFLNTPKIYYSFNGAKNFLKQQVMENTSNYLGKRLTYFDYLENCKNDDPVCSYSSFLFVTDPNEIDRFFEVVQTLSEEPLQVSSKALEIKDTYATFIESFSGTLIVFVLIAFVGINFILGMISLSTFLDNRKNTAILTCLGARNSSIYSIHLFENYLVIILSFISSIFLSLFGQSKINPIILSKFGLENLINIPLKSYLGIRYGLPIFILGVALICSTLFTLVPMIMYRNNSLTDELRDE